MTTKKQFALKCNEILAEYFGNYELTRNAAGYYSISAKCQLAGATGYTQLNVPTCAESPRDIYLFLRGYTDRLYLDQYHKRITRAIKVAHNSNSYKELCECYFANYYDNITLLHEDKKIKVCAHGSPKYAFKSYRELWEHIEAVTTLSQFDCYKTPFLKLVKP